MANIAVITPSYALDFELCRDLNTSVLEHTPDSTIHYVVTPRRDLALFSVLCGPRTVVWPVDYFLPKHFLTLPGNLWLNSRRPFPPIRGWVMQQLVKMQLASQIDGDILLLADSDVLFIRPVTASTFRLDGETIFYRKAGAVDQNLSRHCIWHKVARSLLGLPAGSPPFSDYISPFNVWDRTLVLTMQDRIHQVTGRPWMEATAAQLHISEFILYGVFVDEVLGKAAKVAPTSSMLCHSYWGHEPLTLDAARQFVGATPSQDVAIMISAKSQTPLGIRRTALSAMS